jgi:DUF1009 family protein
MHINFISNRNDLDVYCIIAGNGRLPQMIFEYLLSCDKKVIVITFCSTDYSIMEKLCKNKANFYIINNNISDIIKIMKNNNVKNIVMAGGISFPGIKNIKCNFSLLFDFLKILLSPNKGDDFLLRSAIRIFEKRGFNVISVKDILPNAIAQITDSVGFCHDIKSVNLGINLLYSLSDFDIGQSVVVKNQRVLGIEAVEGTDQLIARCVNSNGAILIKMAKKNQSIKADLPTIGPHTIDQLSEKSFAGIVIQEGSTIIIDREIVLDKIKAAGMFLKIINC